MDKKYVERLLEFYFVNYHKKNVSIAHLYNNNPQISKQTNFKTAEKNTLINFTPLIRLLSVDGINFKPKFCKS